jgi:hemerythrin superfamily protein
MATTAKNTGDAIALLRADHEEVDRLFQQYESATSSAQKKDLISKICSELTVHAQIEEEIFYPAVKSILKGGKEEQELVPEAKVEHSAIKSLIAEVEGVESEEEMDEMIDARIKVMCEYVRHHVKEEQEKIFPKVQAAKLDTARLGRQLAERKAELMEAVA